MKLNRGLHLAYCTNIHRGETWPQTLENLRRHTLAVRERVCPGKPYAIGLRLGHEAAAELSQPAALKEFRHWLDKHGCYVFTINGFPYGRFHGTRVKEQVYAPDWTTPERVDYTLRLFRLLAELVPAGGEMEGSVSTVPGSFKPFIQTAEQECRMRDNLWQCIEEIARLSERTGRMLHLDLEPEPLCYVETSAETAAFFSKLREDRPGDDRLERHLRVNYDACHLAVEFERPQEAIARLREAGARIGKVHISSALKVSPTAEARQALRSFTDPVYLHQVVERGPSGTLRRFRDLEEALAEPTTAATGSLEWRIHFHVPLHARPAAGFGDTREDLTELLDAVAADPGLCTHFEMETYTWEVMPEAMKARDVVDQLEAEYEWTLDQFSRRGLGPV